MARAERRARGLEGLLPAGPPPSLRVEAERLWRGVQRAGSDLDRYQLLVGAAAQQRDVFYACLAEHTEEVLPLVYTPTVGEACLQFSTLVQRPPGLYVGADDAGRVADLVDNWPSDAVRIAVVTDGERILGLGDLGAQGMGIAAGKAMVYTACGEVPPDWLLPIQVDVGCNTAAVRDDPLYIGLPRERVRGAAYVGLLDELVAALQARYGPEVLVHWEDLGSANAFDVLRRYQERGVVTFNDDIQGTSAAVLSGLLGALRQRGVAPLEQQRFLFFGAGQANLGCAELLVLALKRRGLSDAEARWRIWLVDSQGLVAADRSQLSAGKAAFARADAPPGLGAGAALEDIVAAVKPSALIGAASVPGTFGTGVLEAMGRNHARPIVFALSNPLSKAECTAQEAFDHTDGRVVFASGTKYPKIELPNGRSWNPSQANNALVFPGLGLGAVGASATKVTEEMLLAAAEAVASMLTQEEVAACSVLPGVKRITDVALKVATSVGLAADAACDTEGRSLCCEQGAPLRKCLHALQYDALSGSEGRAV